jgi:hypothetical protein
MNTSTATPVEIDTEIARLSGVIAKAEAGKARAEDFLSRRAAAEDWEREGYSWFSQAKADEASETVDAAINAIAAASAAMAPLTAEFVSRGGWSRFYLVTNAGGHVHWTTGCTTCFPTTEFAWLTAYSGMDHAEFVEEAGAKACTVCFPDAPVEVYSRATRIKYETEEAKARREEREAKKAAAEAAQVVVEGFIGYSHRVETKTFKTVRAVTNMIADRLGSLCWYGETHPSAAEWLNNITAARKALDAKGADYDYDKALAAARKKVTKDGGEPKF